MNILDLLQIIIIPAQINICIFCYSSTSRLLSESHDDLLLSMDDEVTLDDAEQIDDLLMDIDSLLD